MPPPAAVAAATPPGAVGVSRAANTLATLSHEIPTALLPSLVTNTLGASAAAVGVIEGVADGMASVARLSGGALAADPAVRRRTSLLGYTGTTVFSALLGVAGAAWQVGAARTTAWTFRGLRTPGRYVGVAQRTVAARLGRAPRTTSGSVCGCGPCSGAAWAGRSPPSVRSSAATSP